MQYISVLQKKYRDGKEAISRCARPTVTTRVVPGALLTGFFRAFFALGTPPVPATIDRAGELALVPVATLEGRPRFLAPAFPPADIILAERWYAFCCVARLRCAVVA